MVTGQLDSHLKNLEVPSLICYNKLNAKWIKDLNMKIESRKKIEKIFVIPSGRKPFQT